MFDKKFIPTARNIKITKIVLILCSMFLFIFAFFMFSQADEFAGNEYYYWSSAVRGLASLFTACGVCLFVLGFIELMLGILCWILERNGKVCPKCEHVYFSTVINCSACNTNLTHAMSVKEYLLNKPTVAGQTPAAENPPAYNRGNPNAVTKKYCPFCGKKVSEDAAFCPNCGNKVL